MAVVPQSTESRSASRYPACSRTLSLLSAMLHAYFIAFDILGPVQRPLIRKPGLAITGARV